MTIGRGRRPTRLLRDLPAVAEQAGGVQVDWRGRWIEDASRFAAERATGDWWRQNHLRLKIAEIGMWALLLAGFLAGLTFLHAAQGVKAEAEAEWLRARQRREQMEARYCREWPKWCREERASWAAGR